MKRYNQMSHPGIILKREFMIPYEISAYRLAKDARIDNMAISEILRCKRSISTKTALKLSKFFGVSDSYFINLQKEYDIRKLKEQMSEELSNINVLQTAQN